jgi:hypothetical protein
MRKTRQLHLWIGLICSVFILIEAVTGLFLLEPQLLGGGGGAPPQMMQQQTPAGTDSSDTNVAAPSARADAGSFPRIKLSAGAVSSDTNAAAPASGADAGSFPRNGNMGPGREGGTGAINFIRNLHQGRIGNTDISWVMDITAIGMIILTITGIVMSTKILAAQSVRRRKRRIELHE